MAEYDYERGRLWVNEEDGPGPDDPKADAQWFMDTEETIHQIIEDAEAGGGDDSGGSGGGGTAIEVYALRGGFDYTNLSEAAWRVLPFEGLDLGNDLAYLSPYGVQVEPGIYEADLTVNAQIEGKTPGAASNFAICLGNPDSLEYHSDTNGVTGQWQPITITDAPASETDYVAPIRDHRLFQVINPSILFAQVAANQNMLIAGNSYGFGRRLDIKRIADLPE